MPPARSARPLVTSHYLANTDPGTTYGQAPGPGLQRKLNGRAGTCTLPAGWGTDHKGFGRCRKHFGNAPNVIKAAENERLSAETSRALEGFTEFTEVTNPVQRLPLLARRTEAWMAALEIKVAQLT